MRRLLFNPLAQKPYSSGEYETNGNDIARFTLDKSIEVGHVYYCRLCSTSKSSLTSFILDNTDTSFDTYVTSPFIFINSDGIAKTFYGTSTKNSNYIDIDKNVDTPTANESYVIYIYKLI